MQKRIGVLFVSRRNSLRSVLAEACLTHIAEARFEARSCGQPLMIEKSIHPAALAALNSAGIAPPASSPRSWLEFSPSRGFQAEFVISLDAETLGLHPRWPGQPHTALWDYPDAAGAKDPAEAARLAVQVLYSLRRRLELLVSLPFAGADREAVRSDLRDLGHMQ